MRIKQFYYSIIASVLFFLLLVTFSSAKRCVTSKPKLLRLASVHIVDRNGFSETISNKERLNQFQNVNFLTPQPYQKVLRIYARDSQGNIRSVVTTYHENGNAKQFLEVLNARAYGSYCEWHENGMMSVNSRVIGGTADVTAIAEKTWLFDGLSCAWDEEQNQIAEISYSQGVLEGVTTYFHPNGKIWKILPYTKNQLDGCVEIYRNNGELLQQMSYNMGQRDGATRRYWTSEQLASEEQFCKGKLECGIYFNSQGNVVAQVEKGSGYRAVFGKKGVQELQEYLNGSLEGEVQVFNQEEVLKRVYHVKNGIKHGEEIEYYGQNRDSTVPPQPKLSFNWYEGKVQGVAKTWYATGVLESQKEMSNNTKNGLLTAWYRDGSLMMIEEYDSDSLVRGDYFRKGDRFPISQVTDGKGTVTVFDAEGHFVQRVPYVRGHPEV